MLYTPQVYSYDLQSTLSAGSALPPDRITVHPHHPITCVQNIRFEEDGTFACEHATAPPGDLRTQHCLNASMALLLVEQAFAL